MSRRPSRNPIIAIRRAQALPRWVRWMDAAAARRVNTRRALPSADRAYTTLSRVADHGVLWFSIAALLAAMGRRRAAIRGVASLTVASVLANLVGKRLFGGDRPLLKDVPVGRRLARSPASPSFPSGHSASAAAFATGVALESGRGGLVIAPLAAAVAYSRLHTGAHWLSDVVGGAAIGAGVAAAGRFAVPARHRRSSPPSRAVIELPTLPDGEGAFIVVNPSSGDSVLRADPTAVIGRRLPRARVHLLADGERVADVVRAAVAATNRPRVLGVCGGDGTVATVAHLAREARLPLLVLPGGTFNHFARTAGVESVDAAIDALQAGTGLRADVADLAFGDNEPMTVVNTASVGVYPDFVAEREKLQARLGKWAAGLWAAARVLRASDPVRVDIDGRAATVWSLYVGVNRNYPLVVAPLQRRRLDDGVLDVRVLHAGSRASAVWSLAFGLRTSAVLRRLHAWPGAASIESFTATEVTVTVHPRHDQPPGLAHDGEVDVEPGGHAGPGSYVSRVRIIPGGLELYAESMAAESKPGEPIPHRPNLRGRRA